MNLYTRAGNRKRFRRIVHLQLQFLKHSVEDTVLRPATHPLVNGIPSAKLRREASPFTTVLRHVQNGVKHLPVKNSHISSLSRQIRHDPLIPVFWQLHKFKKTPGRNSMVANLTMNNKTMVSSLLRPGIQDSTAIWIGIEPFLIDSLV